MRIRIVSLFAALVVALAVPGASVQADPEGPGHTHAKPATQAPAKTAGGESVLTTKVTPATLAGEIVDPQCWIQHDGRGKAHTGCALACAKAGQTLAFLDDKTGKLYQVLAPSHSADPNEPLYPWVGKPVIVKGDLMARGGMNAIVIKSVVADKAAKQKP
jgi:hypothetical protein